MGVERVFRGYVWRWWREFFGVYGMFLVSQTAQVELRSGRVEAPEHGAPDVARGRAVQVESMKPVLKAPGTLLLRLGCDEPLSNFAFNINLRRYTEQWRLLKRSADKHVAAAAIAERKAMVGRCRLTLSNPRSKRLEPCA